MKLPRLLAVSFLILGTSLLSAPQAYANSGLQAYYYDNYTEDNQYNNAPPIPPITPMVASIPVATVDQDYDLYPVGNLIEDFVVKYEGYLTATESGTVNLQCLADDGCVVIIDGATVINEWWDKGTSGDVYQYTLVPNQSLPITVWYYENGGGAVIQLRWQFPDGDWQVVPEAVFSTVPKEIAPPVVDTPTYVPEEIAPTPPAEQPAPPPAPQPAPPVVQPEPEPLPEVAPEPTPEPEPVPSPAPEPAPEPQPEPEPVPEPSPEIAPEPPVVEELPPALPDEPSEPPVVEPVQETIQQGSVDLHTLPPETPVQLANGVVVTAEVAIAVELLSNPTELLGEIFTNPAEALAALGNVGADLPPEVRKKAKKVVISAVIAGNIATQAAASAASLSTYRRKP